MRIIVFCLQGLGNAILYLPLLKSLKIKYNEINLVVPQNGANIFYNNSPLIKKVITMSQFLKKYRNTYYDVALATYPNWRRENLFLFLSKAKKKYNFYSTRNYFSFLFFLNPTNSVPNYSIHDLDNTCNLMKIKPDFNICLTDIDKSLSENISNQNFLPYLAMHFTSSTNIKRIPSREVALTIEKILLNNENGIKRIYLLGTNHELPVNIEIRNFLDEKLKTKVLIPENLSIIETTKLIYSCDYFIGLDSALAHIAALFKKKSIIIWSFANLTRIYPYNPNSHILFNPEIEQVDLFAGNYPNDYKTIEQIKKYKADHILNIFFEKANPTEYIRTQHNFDIPIYDINKI